MSNVLIVDDVPENLYLLNVLLTGYGYAVDEAHDGADALARARYAPPQLVISDLLMPGMDGYALLRRWKADARLRSIPFVVYTATYTDAKDRQLAVALGADAFILKPAEPEQFIAEIAEVLTKAANDELSPAHEPDRDDLALLTNHTEVLIGKLQQKVRQLEQTNRALRDDVARREYAEAKAKRFLDDAERAHATLVSTQEAFSQKTAQLETALNMARMGVWFWDLRADQSIALERSGPVTGLPASDFPTNQQAFLALVHPDDRVTTRLAVERAKLGADYNAEYRIVLAGGEVRWVAVRGRCLYDAAGEPIALTGLDQDTTEQKSLQERLRHSQKMEAIGQLAGGIAHDFNNILAAIVGNAELARLDVEPEHPARVSIVEILRAGCRAKELVQRILSFSRPQAAAVRTIQLQPVLEEAQRLLRATLPAGVELSFHGAPSLPAVRADASQIHQIVLNLVTNAWHALENHPGRIETRLEACRVDNGLCQHHADLHPGPYVHLSVSDTGKGMDAATLEHIFEPFFTTKAHGEGAGLGLSVVHGIVRGHGGAIFAESQVGDGATFHVYLPVAGVEELTASVSEATPTGEVGGHGERILYIDDEEALVYLAARFLERDGYRVDAFTHVDAALRAFRARPDSYDVVITDFNMPGMSGMELAEQLLRIRPDAPIALSSGYLRPAEIASAHALGIREVFPKPYLIEELGPLVQRMLSGRAGEAHTPAAW
jgi:two-component system, cell cycle sensor histidine kinase and response regulator CckA